MKKTVKMQMYVHRKADGSETLDQYDHTENNTQQAWIDIQGAMIGRVEVFIDYESPEDVDPVQVIVAGLEKAIEKERADSQVRVNLLLERISKLQAIGHEVAE